MIRECGGFQVKILQAPPFLNDDNAGLGSFFNSYFVCKDRKRTFAFNVQIFHRDRCVKQVSSEGFFLEIILQLFSFKYADLYRVENSCSRLPLVANPSSRVISTSLQSHLCS